MAVKRFVGDADGSLHRELLRRREVKQLLPYTEADFAGNTQAYNDFLERVEDLVTDMVAGIDVTGEVRSYRRAVEAIIAEASAAATASRAQAADNTGVKGAEATTSSDVLPIHCGPAMPPAERIAAASVQAVGGSIGGMGTARWVAEAYTCLFDF